MDAQRKSYVKLAAPVIVGFIIFRRECLIWQLLSLFSVARLFLLCYNISRCKKRTRV